MIENDGLTLSNLTSMDELSEAEVMALIERASQFKRGEVELPQFLTTFVSNLFFENSTRTHQSFHVAERKLGLEVLEFEAKGSSITKGETLYDTILTLSALGVKVAVIRSKEEKYYETLVKADHLNCAIVNAGDGFGQHPSQCLLDLMTIYEEFGHFEGLKIAISGDLSHSRVAKSNMVMLKKLGATLYFTGLEKWYTQEFNAFGTHCLIDDILPELDVQMLLRVQFERHESGEIFSKADYHEQYGLTNARAKLLRASAIIMHPAPVNRDVEIADDLVESAQSRILQQMTNGIYVRMTILEAILKGQKLKQIKER